MNLKRVKKRILGKKRGCKGPGVGGSIVNSKRINISRGGRTKHNKSSAEAREDLRILFQGW